MGVGSYSSSPSITSNNIFTDNVYGVYINSGSPLTVSGNTFTSNSAYGLYFRYASPLVLGNTFSNNYRGLYGYSTYSDVRDNTASGNIYWGMYLSRSSSDIDENTVSGGQYGMIVAWDMGTPPTVTDNTITDATYGLYIYGTDADVRGTTPWAQVLRSNVHNMLIGYCSPTVQWNYINTEFVGADPISHVGIHIYPQSSPTIHVNYILNMRYFGIVANNQTSGTISNGYIYSWYWRSRAGVQIYDSTIQVRYNWLSVRVYDIFTQQASATIEYNNMFPFFVTNYRGILNYQSTALNVIRGNTITGHQRDGIYDSWSASQIEGNTVTNNYAGVTLYRSTSVVSNNNQLNSNSYYGIRICTPGQAPLVTDNTMNSNRYGVYVYCANSMPTITGNTINSNTEDGLLSVLATPTLGSATNPNTFKFNGGWGIHSQFAAPLNAGVLGATLEAENIFGRGAEVNALGDIVQEWRVRVYVTHLGVPVADADVTVWQENQYPPEDEVWTGKTNALGYTPWISSPYLKEYEWDNTGTLYERDDHLFLAVKMPEGWTDSDIEKVDHDLITVHLEID
jgi:parallel beta-helix repeat protein